MKHILSSEKVRNALKILGSLAAAFLFFGMGMLVGYRRGVFSSRFGEDYYANFLGKGGPAGVMMLGGTPIMNPHGAAGVVLDVGGSVISAQDPDGDEESITVSTGTVIRRMDQTISADDILPGEAITVIGAPNAQGQIVARFIRVFPGTSSAPWAAAIATTSATSAGPAAFARAGSPSVVCIPVASSSLPSAGADASSSVSTSTSS